MIRSPHLVLAGGGCLGNLYPGLAVAKQLSQLCPKLELSFVGSGEPSERHEALTVCHNYLSVPAQPMPRSPLEGIRYLTDNAAGYWASRWLLGEKNASLLLALGGPVSAVMARAAHSRRTPFVLLEANARPSRTARALGGFAEAVCLSHPESQTGMPVETPLVVTGTPTRADFDGVPRLVAEHAGQKQLLVMAGANGKRAENLNRGVVAALTQVPQQLEGWRIVHQAGQGQLQKVEQAYQASGLDALVVTQLDEIATAFAASDLAICRAGASTLAELAAAGLPSILVPDPAAPENQQAANAANHVAAGCAVSAMENASEPLEIGLSRQLTELLTNDLRRAQMTKASEAISRPDAALRIAEICAGLLGLGSVRAAA
ncbi:UDP-N-acetylglucosamine--N-acetylmuramyl-(pentapeptide) pyrophosphoryl-undecaprenol N-acetylglucosamine transferase MurG [Posidoniimonas polymericola]|uniref:UDP-N-acetylglucosamine--N-acetylmuramyl-(Pentapeptide) pyrophosphoryl-undecaprenol N-acetylglucosamine transferase MurG n=1 Tax=Posidoniimonas polymericola TaxID=2528002 RepID=A0A5C5YKQ7_9BACT|nr:UDP-N-acetylglucosamine--N-acetylmuramyl-(pentapeptide) pyrophosphoryl-undecaprenol N-acetylglucosamine transferase [Posidoniimonas polymericola]TWT75456.1 UDP-N-acetylglucosamine--N-acetylmuramyl-(pentapeptide) pyrophosphoryl-undecaprenol N-acetylglucosamine transferase MurG [Posidoniimonas polymericola]